MHHFIIIDEASPEIEPMRSELQETTLEKGTEQGHFSKNILKSTAHFLHKYFDQSNCDRIFISKN